MSRPLRHRIERALVRTLPPTVSRRLGAMYGCLIPPAKSYSQFGEDLIVRSFFQALGQEKGVYVDVGAFHPRWLSNTHLLARSGWSGTVIDIDPAKVDLCVRRRGDDRCLGITAAVGESSGDTVTAYRFERLWSEIDTLSEAGARDTALRTGIRCTPCELRAIAANEVMERTVTQFGSVDFLNIDIEGLDETVLNELDFNRFRPTVICFEDNKHFAGSPRAVDLLAAERYRHLATVGGSHLYADETAALRATGH